MLSITPYDETSFGKECQAIAIGVREVDNEYQSAQLPISVCGIRCRLMERRIE